MTWLHVALGSLVLASWLSTGLLVRAAMRRPFIGALIERAIIGTLLSIYGTVGVVLRVNTDTGFAFMSLDVARGLFIASLLSLLCVAPIWLLLYAANRLGSGR